MHMRDIHDNTCDSRRVAYSNPSDLLTMWVLMIELGTSALEAYGFTLPASKFKRFHLPAQC